MTADSNRLAGFACRPGLSETPARRRDEERRQLRAMGDEEILVVAPFGAGGKGIGAQERRCIVKDHRLVRQDIGVAIENHVVDGCLQLSSLTVHRVHFTLGANSA